jgi:hypothetical protein
VRRSSSETKVKKPDENSFEFQDGNKSFFQSKPGPNVNFKIIRKNSNNLSEAEKFEFKVKLQEKLKTEVINL